ncbi:MAG: hypothetical protein KDB07_06090, partial [Planctomycetes bacterium]|nr:hypothetical protein [Planctomycetota bacterium]
PKFTLDVSIVRFSNVMKTIGQVDVLKVGAFNDKDQLPERGGASWPFVVRVDHARIETPDNLKVGQVLKIMVNAQGALEARDVSEN